MYRIYREREFKLRIKPKGRLMREVPDKLVEPKGINDTWSMDFIHDQLSDGRSFRVFNVSGVEPASEFFAGLESSARSQVKA